AVEIRLLPRRQLIAWRPEILAIRMPRADAIRLVEVGNRVIEAERNAVLLTRRRELPQHVAVKRCMHDAVRCGFGVPHRKAIVVLADEYRVTEAALLQHADPGFGIELDRVEALVQIVVDVRRRLHLPAPADFL